MKTLIAQILKKALNEMNVKLKDEEILNFIEIPPSPELGDYAFPCFFLAEKLKSEPREIALEIREKIGENLNGLEDIQTSGAYVNFFVNRKELAEKAISEIILKKEKYGEPVLKEKNKIMIEFSQPNTHKAFHVGHIRGTSLGESISRILEFCGDKVIRANYSGDTGMHVAKWLWCYSRYHSKEKLRDDESWIAGIYVDAVKKLEENSKLQEEVDLIKLSLLWKKTRKLSIGSWEKIYKELGVKFDVSFFESDMEKRGKEISNELRNKKIAVKNKGAIIVNLKKYGLDVWVLLRSDGTVLYSAKDLALAEKKFSKYKINKNIYVIGSAQTLHVKQLFKTLELMDFKIGENIFVPFAEIRLPSGKMSSRSGENILYSEFIREVTDYSKEEIKKRNKDLSKNALEKLALIISIASIKYSMLKQNSGKNIIFRKEDALNFEGDTGAYLLYSYARASSIIRKASVAKKIEKENFDVDEINSEEISLIKKLSQFPEVIENSYKNLNPSLIANYSHSLAQKFNEFYHSCPVLKSEKENFRLMLVKSFICVMENALNLLGIPPIKKM